MHQYLNSSEILALERFNDDPYAAEAIKKIILFRIYYDGVIKEGETQPLKNFMISITDALGQEYTDEELGRVVRARRVAIELLELGMSDIQKFKRIDPREPKKPNHR